MVVHRAAVDWSFAVEGVFSGYERTESVCIEQSAPRPRKRKLSLLSQPTAHTNKTQRTGRERFQDIADTFAHLGVERSHDQRVFHNEFLKACLKHIFRNDLDANFDWLCKELDIKELKKQVIAITPRRWGKCLAPDTPLFTYTGHVVRAADVRIGTLLLGPDQRPRIVTSTIQGTAPMYEVVDRCTGLAFRCNVDHILVVRTNVSERTTCVSVQTLLDGQPPDQTEHIFPHIHTAWAPAARFDTNARRHDFTVPISLHGSPIRHLSDAVLTAPLEDRATLAMSILHNFTQQAVVACPVQHHSHTGSRLECEERDHEDMIRFFASCGYRCIRGHRCLYILDHDDECRGGLLIRALGNGPYHGFTCAAVTSQCSRDEESALLQQPTQTVRRLDELLAAKKLCEAQSCSSRANRTYSPGQFVLANGMVTHNTWSVAMFVVVIALTLEAYPHEAFRQCVFSPSSRQSKMLLQLAKRFLYKFSPNIVVNNADELWLQGPYGKHDIRKIMSYPCKEEVRYSTRCCTHRLALMRFGTLSDASATTGANYSLFATSIYGGVVRKKHEQCA